MPTNHGRGMHLLNWFPKLAQCDINTTKDRIMQICPDYKEFITVNLAANFVMYMAEHGLFWSETQVRTLIITYRMVLVLDFMVDECNEFAIISDVLLDELQVFMSRASIRKPLSYFDFDFQRMLSDDIPIIVEPMATPVILSMVDPSTDISNDIIQRSELLFRDFDSMRQSLDMSRHILAQHQQLLPTMRLFQGLLFCPPEIVPVPVPAPSLDVCSFDILIFVCLLLPLIAGFMRETGVRVAEEKIFAPDFSVKEEKVFISDMHFSSRIPKIQSSLFLDNDHLTHGRRVWGCLLPPPEPPPDPPPVFYLNFIFIIDVQYQLLPDIYLIFIFDTNMIIVIGFLNLKFGFGGSMDVVRGLFLYFYNAPPVLNEPQTQVSNFHFPVIFMIMVSDIDRYYYGYDEVFTPIVSIFSYVEGRGRKCILDAALGACSKYGEGSGRMCIFDAALVRTFDLIAGSKYIH